MRNLVLLPALLLLASCTADAPDTTSVAASPDTTPATTAPADTPTPEQYVGTEYPPVPDELTKRGGALIVPPGTPAEEASICLHEYGATPAW